MKAPILLVSFLLVSCASDGVQQSQPGVPGQNGGNNQNPMAGACFDRDADGYQDANCNPSKNGIPRGGDCDDYSSARSPGKREDCSNNVDNDCDGLVGARDPDCMKECEDMDNDGYQDARCNSDVRRRGGDCDDTNRNVNPGRTEQCGNMLDDDCRGGDLPCLANCEDRDRDGFGLGAGCYGPDCNDNDPNINPWATDICTTTIDEDCDNQLAACRNNCVDRDGDGYGNEGTDCRGTDCNDEDPRVHPGAREIPGDGIDQDCNGTDLPRDIDCPGDRDGDGYGPQMAGGCLGIDCDERDPRVHQGRFDGCDNGRDDDCMGGDRVCNPAANSGCTPNPQTFGLELCNDVDDDCDTRVDECPRRNQSCVNGECVGGPGAPCSNDTECDSGRLLYCNLELRECRIQDGEACSSSTECNPTATCEVGLCGSSQLCYQALSGSCLDPCDCADKYTCNANQRCVQCATDSACTDDPNRPKCSEGGFCVAEVSFVTTAGYLCENTCCEPGTSCYQTNRGDFEDDDPWVFDGVCDEVGSTDPGSYGGCERGTDCADCCPEGEVCNEGFVTEEYTDTLGRVLYEMVSCWNRFLTSTEPQGCAQLVLPQALTANGSSVFSIGGSSQLEGTICEGGLLGGCNYSTLEAMGLSDSDAGAICDIFGCGTFNLSNLEWNDSNALTAGATDMCIYYSPSRRGFSAIDTTRNAIIVERCSISDLY